jgi:hypothetical protein
MLMTAVALSVNPQPPDIDKSALHPQKFNKRFYQMPLSRDSKTVLNYLGKVTTAQFSDRLRATRNDPHAHDRVISEISVKMQRIRDSIIDFKGQNTGYNVSVVSDEFAHNSGESMMVMPIKNAHDYYFFVQGKGLWKVVTTATSRQRFPVFLLELTQIYGAAATVEYADPATRENPEKAVWDDGLFRLEAHSRLDYGAITITWALSDVAGKIAKLRGANKPPAAGLGDDLDPSILEILQD